MYKSPVTESQGFGTLIRADTCYGFRSLDLILAGLASHVTTSLTPSNDIKPISAPLKLRSRPGLRQDKQANGGKVKNLTSSGKKLALPRLAVR